MTAPRQQAVDLFDTFLQLREEGGAHPLKWTEDFWRRLAAGERDRVVGAKHGVEPDDFHPDEWEMHPSGDEFLFLLTGAIDVVFDEPDGERALPLRGGQGGQGCIVPRVVWHRLIMQGPSDLLFITPPRGTQHRTVVASRTAS